MAIINSDFLNFAIDCYGRKDEIGFRNSISRSYYAIYHKSLANAEMPRCAANHHAALINYIDGLGNQKDQKMKELARLLRLMRKARNDADYNLDVTMTDKLALQNFKHYRLIDELWSQVLPEIRSTK
ncbi:hypothetical protein ABK178_002755 [Salmonella enterica subsp. enterica serovar Brandenburg]|uniref:HEPN domain-containing protein n=2 Tax=Salmonella enterica TaxID=28901 RepID=A0A761PAT9_SALER|nr:hypothetical protein [Salmonella enterica subsp. enterica serovar Newport]ECC9276577.1 hypothetical protein [Salmonella enterica subsp. enterica]EDA0854564.1 hypothetical protein [Salmonella enterica]EGI5054930.1 hypothetical protein [Salmonella enterica subsp. enterica serovar Worthington]HAE1794077.1 hypothetical protein [Salmonella enterica subsp. enterica serovar Ank]